MYTLNMGQVTIEQWDIICAVEQFWHENRHFPSTPQIAEMTKLTPEVIMDNLQDPVVKVRIVNRGISYDATPPQLKGETSKNKTLLTDKQLAAAMCILNVADPRSLRSKLESLGIPQSTYNGWTKNKTFTDFMNSQMESMFGAAMPLAHKALIDKVISGDVKAIKLYYEMTGRWNGQQSQETSNVKMVIIRLIEILQKHINDPIVLAAIAEEMKALAPTMFGGATNNGNHTTVRAELTSG